MNAHATLVTPDRLQALLARGAVLVVDCRCDLADAEGGARAIGRAMCPVRCMPTSSTTCPTSRKPDSGAIRCPF